MSKDTILVTGAAGSVGSTARTAITILLEQGHRVRAMVRKLDARADALRDLGAEVVILAVKETMRDFARAPCQFRGRAADTSPWATCPAEG